MRKRKYVYMIDYIWNDTEESDQCECETPEEVLKELRHLKDKVKVINVKLVEDENRYNELEVSYSMGQDVLAILHYVPVYMMVRNKGERL